MFYIVDEDKIKANRTTDVYFVRTVQILRAKGINKRVKMEVFLKNLPDNYPWGIFVGLEDVLHLFEGDPVDIYALPEGSVFYAGEPVMTIEGNYVDFAERETAMLGLICQASGVATKSARITKLAKGKSVVHFGARRMHPAITPMIDRAAYIGGMDGVATLAGAEAIGKKPIGTMPHALMLVVGDTLEAAKMFDEVISEDVPRIVLIDTFMDEKFESIRVAEEMGKKLSGIRLDTPGSRKGNFRKIVEEVRWELDIRGYHNVKILVSGGIDEESVKELADVVDSFGVGTSVSNAKTFDFSADIVEVEGKPIAKRGKLSGAKKLWVCDNCGNRKVTLMEEGKVVCDRCGNPMKPLTRKYMESGNIIEKLPSADEIRNYVLEQVRNLEV